jgi:hypothetical protein
MPSFHADLHIHSKYSRATSRDLDLEHLSYWAGRKGVAVVGAGRKLPRQADSAFGDCSPCVGLGRKVSGGFRSRLS